MLAYNSYTYGDAEDTVLKLERFKIQSAKCIQWKSSINMVKMVMDVVISREVLPHKHIRRRIQKFPFRSAERVLHRSINPIREMQGKHIASEVEKAIGHGIQKKSMNKTIRMLS